MSTLISTTEIRLYRGVSRLLLALVVSFTSLVPGGPLETRDFSALGKTVIWGFNAFLVVLGVAALIATYLTRRGHTLAFRAAIVIAWLYLTVIILDWSHVFPRSAEPMSVWLCMVEIFDAMLCGYIVLFSHKALGDI